MTAMLTVAGAIAGLVAAFVVWRIYATVAGGRRAYARLLEAIAPVTRALAERREPDPEDVLRFARDRNTRKVLHGVLAHAGKVHLFPHALLTWEAMAEADLVSWLNHPNELGAFPDEIELMARVPAPAGAGQYFVFRFKTAPPHWAAADGWKAGVAGPYDLGAAPVPHGRGTFSRFEAYDSRTPEGHVEAAPRAAAERKS